MKKIRITEGDLKKIVKNSVMRILRESVQGDDENDYSEFGEYAGLAKDIVSRVREYYNKMDSDEFFWDNAQWYGDSCTVEYNAELNGDDFGFDGGQYGIHYIGVDATIKGNGNQTYYMSADDWHPEESDGNASAEVWIDRIYLEFEDGSDEEFETELFVDEISVYW